MIPQMPKAELRCPYCADPAKLAMTSINQRVECPNCEGQFLASPEPMKDLILLPAACSYVLQPYLIVYQKENGRYRLRAVVHPKKKGRSQSATQKVASIDIAIFDLTLGFTCPWCTSSGLDLCGCHTFICHGASRPHTPGLRLNTCPQCGDGQFTEPLLEVPIYSAPPAVRRDAPVKPMQPKPALSSGLAVAKWRGQ